MNKALFLVSIIFYAKCVFSHDEIEVSLSMKKSLSPTYLSQVYNEKASFDETYLEKVREVLSFDLDHNALMELLPREKQKDILLSHENEKIAFEPKIWEKSKCIYVIKALVSEKNLQVQVYEASVKLVKNFSSHLTGELSIDRHKIHQLADSILQVFFGKIGIANLHILYSVRTPAPQSSNRKWLSEIWICDYDGVNARQLTHENSYCVHPIFLPKEKQSFIYVSYKSGQPKLYKAYLDKQDNFSILSLRGNQLLPAISLQHDKLALISDAAGRPDLFLQYLDKEGKMFGKPLQLFSYPRATQASPTFSPDGKKIAFVSDKDGSCRIYVIQIPKRNENNKRPIAVLITKKNRQNVTPSWSPDGTKLAYSAKTDNERQIWIYDFELDEEWQLTKGPKNKENPFWAPDSTHIVYNTEDDSSSELYLVDINKQQPVMISQGNGKKRFPSWEPM